MSLEFKKISGSTPYLLNSASTAEELTVALEDYMRTGAQIIFQHDGEACILTSFEYKTGIESTVIAYFVTPKKKLLKVDIGSGWDLVVTESDITPDIDITWENLQDKPFGETVISGDTLTVDWSTFEPKVTVDALGTSMVMVSDAVPTIDDFANGCTFIMQSFDGEKTEEVPSDIIPTMYNDVGCFTTGNILIAPSDNFVFDIGDGDVWTFPVKGVYFAKDMVTSLTIPNYNFTYTTLKKIDEKYLPDYRAMIDEAIGNAIGGSY